jgi:hypothetical protein
MQKIYFTIPNWYASSIQECKAANCLNLFKIINRANKDHFVAQGIIALN